MPYHQLIFETITGSHLYGTDTPASDRDYRGVAIEHPRDVTGLGQWEQTVTRDQKEGVRSQPGDVDRTVYGLRKFMRLATKGNPSIIELLYAPEGMQTIATAAGRGLQLMAPLVVSRNAIGNYLGYMRSQALAFCGVGGTGRGQRAGNREELVDQYGYDTKFAAHMVRLGLQGVELCRMGQLVLPMRGDELEFVRRVRAGEETADEVFAKTLVLDEQLRGYLDDPASTPRLLDEPNLEWVQGWMHLIYLEAWA